MGRELPERFFLAAARFVAKKNLTGLLRAYALYRTAWGEAAGGESAGNTRGFRPPGVPSAAGPWDLVVLGNGPLEPALRELIGELGLEAHVRLPGFKQYPELPVYYGRAGAFVHASSTEQWGLVVNEAMASGLPVLVSNRCGCAADLVREGVNGFTFDPWNLEELAHLLLRITQTPKTRLLEMGLAGRRIIAAWGPERFAAGLRMAAETALWVPRPRATMLDRIWLRTLTALDRGSSN